MTIKKVALSLMILSGSFAYAGERDDINQILKEIIYTKEVVKKIKQKYGKSKAKVTFNYDALILQLNATENGIKEFLNLQIKTLHSAPPKPVVNPLYNVREN